MGGSSGFVPRLWRPVAIVWNHLYTKQQGNFLQKLPGDYMAAPPSGAGWRKGAIISHENRFSPEHICVSFFSRVFCPDGGAFRTGRSILVVWQNGDLYHVQSCSFLHELWLLLDILSNRCKKETVMYSIIWFI